MSAIHVLQQPSTLPARWTPEADRLLHEHIRVGLSSRQSAEILGVSPSAAVSRAFRKGWRFNSGLKGKSAVQQSAPPAPKPRRGYEGLRPAPTSELARPWLTRRFGECAFPIDGVGGETLSCCAPCGERTYCDKHHAFMRLPTSPADAFVAKLARYINAGSAPA